jgi:hypothetical protein
MEASLAGLRLEALTPADLAVLMQRRWGDFVPVVASGLEELRGWVSRRLSPAAAGEFAERIPSQPSADRIIAEFVTEFAPAGALGFMGVTASRASLLELAMRGGGAMAVSTVGDVFAVVPGKGSRLADYAVELHRSGALHAYERRPETDLAGVADLWQSHLEVWMSATGTGEEPSADVLATLLVASLTPTVAERLTELAAEAVDRARGERMPLWDRLGESPGVDLAIENSAAESERLRLHDLRLALVQYGLIEERDDVPTPEKLAYLLGLHWDLALRLTILNGFGARSGLAALALVLVGENRALPRPPIRNTLADLDRFLAEIIVALDPAGYPRFMGVPVAVSDLVEFSNVSGVMGAFGEFPGTFAVPTKPGEWSDLYPERIGRLFLSGALSVYATLPGHARLGTVDKQWHELSDKLDVRTNPRATTIWRGVLLCCLADLGWATRLGAEAAVRSADVRARKSRWFRAWVAGTSIVVDLAIVVNHDEAAVAGDFGHAMRVGVRRGLFLVIPAFLLAWVILFLGRRFDPMTTITVAVVIAMVTMIIAAALAVLAEATSVSRRRRSRRGTVR